MRETWTNFRCFAGRFKLIAALLAVLACGAMLAMGLCAYYYNEALTRQQGAYERQVARLESDLILERDINRDRIEAVATDIDSIVSSIGVLLSIAKSASKVAQQAAITAQGAAKNAAKANITITETPPPAPEPVNPFPERIEP